MKRSEIKAIIDKQLSEVVVTEQLKQKMLAKIKRPKKYFYNFKYFTRLSLLSSFAIISLIGFNLLFNNKTISPVLTNNGNFLENINESKSSVPTSEKAPSTTNKDNLDLEKDNENEKG